MLISANELIELFEGVYEIDTQVAALNKTKAGMLDGYAVSNELGKNAIKQAYKAFTNFKKGTVTTSDEDYFALQAIVEEHFSGSGNNANSADTVAI